MDLRSETRREAGLVYKKSSDGDVDAILKNMPQGLQAIPPPSQPPVSSSK